MKALVLDILLVITAGLSGAYFECERLVASLKWKPEYVKVPFWDDIWIIPNSDSYHLMFGICASALMFITIDALKLFNKLTWKWTAFVFVLIWFGFFWVRNIGMHILFVNDNRWWYWFPPILADLVKLIAG